MIIFKTKEKVDTRIGKNYPIAHRKALSIARWYIDWQDQYLSSHDGKWHDIHSGGYGISITPHWYWGFEHVYYDGPHCFLSLGYLHIMFTGNRWCKKCAGEI
jgi:hypothetical protein